MTLAFTSPHGKGIYNHPGLEENYSIETIDIKTIRLLSDSVTTLSLPFQEKLLLLEPIEQESTQWDFDFGGEFSREIKPLVLEEPIQVLRLSQHAEKTLRIHEKLVLRDLIKLNQQEFIFIRGLGQGHIDEIKQKLQTYLADQLIQTKPHIDWTSLIRILSGSMAKLKLALIFEPFGLDAFISLSSAEQLEMRRLSHEERLKLHQEAEEEICSSRNKHVIHDILTDFLNVIIKPWVRRREGLATDDELLERLQRSCQNPELTAPMLSFISEVFFKHQCVFNSYLTEIRPGLYGIDSGIKWMYQSVIQKALTYFYKPYIVYELEELVEFLFKEFALKWENVSCAFISKVLQFDGVFRVCKNEEHRLIVKLN